MGEKVIDMAWDINPNNVLGFLVVILICAIIWLAYQLNTSRKDAKESKQKLIDKLIEMNTSNVEVLKDLNTSLLLLKEEGENMGSQLKEHINFTREHISEKINNLKNFKL